MRPQAAGVEQQAVGAVEAMLAVAAAAAPVAMAAVLDASYAAPTWAAPAVTPHSWLAWSGGWLWDQWASLAACACHADAAAPLHTAPDTQPCSCYPLAA